jgi:hypothetical protein
MDNPASLHSPAFTSRGSPTGEDMKMTLSKETRSGDLAGKAFDLLSEEELTEIADRAAERRAPAPEPWSSVYDTIFTLAHASLAGKLSDPAA